MAENNQEYVKDLQEAAIKTRIERMRQMNPHLKSKNIQEKFKQDTATIVEDDEPMSQFINEMSKRIIQQELSKKKIKKFAKSSISKNC